MDSSAMNIGDMDFTAVESMNIGIGGLKLGYGASARNINLLAPRPGYNQDTGYAGEMFYVSIESPRAPVVQPYPVVFVAGEFHNSHIWLAKPDGGRGWAYDIADAGFKVYCPELCYSSNDQLDGQSPELASKLREVDPAVIEIENTAPEKSGWLSVPSAPVHNKWPGTGQQGDPIFEQYIIDYTVPSLLDRHDQQSRGQRDIHALLAQLGSSIIIAEGSGASIAWLAADADPNLVKAVIAIEPTGGPGGSAVKVINGIRRFQPIVLPDAENPYAKRPYGLTDIPLTFEPPVGAQAVDAQGRALPVLDLCPTQMTDSTVYMLQKTGGNSVQWDIYGNMLPSNAPLEYPRQLVHLSRAKHLVVTSPWSKNSYTDGNVVAFMHQAGVGVDWLQLAQHNIHGNGHFMYLETNSDEIALELFTWMSKNVDGVIGDQPCLELAKDVWGDMYSWDSLQVRI